MLPRIRMKIKQRVSILIGLVCALIFIEMCSFMASHYKTVPKHKKSYDMQDTKGSKEYLNVFQKVLGDNNFTGSINGIERPAHQKNDINLNSELKLIEDILHNKIFHLELGDIALPGGKWVQHKQPQEVELTGEIAQGLQHIYDVVNAHQETTRPKKKNIQKLINYKSDR